MILSTSGLPIILALILLFAVLLWAGLHRPREDRMSQAWLERHRDTEVGR